MEAPGRRLFWAAAHRDPTPDYTLVKVLFAPPTVAKGPGMVLEDPQRSPPGQAVSLSGTNIRARSCSTALVWIWHTRLSVTPRTWPISANVKPS